MQGAGQLRRHVVVVAEREQGRRIGIDPIEARQDLTRQARDHALRAPARIGSEQAIAATLSCTSPTHSNGLWPPVPVRLREARVLGVVVEHRRAEDRAQLCRRQERREDQEDEPALVAVAAPRARATGLVEPENAIAGGEHAVVARHPRERPGDRQLRGRAAGPRRSQARRRSRRPRRTAAARRARSWRTGG